ncbi:hypothetical protein GN958_ATG03987 [Phytophthora infestans]|uniref:Uncharacterized protein n=1 Tax=Phytophthora infestans TaxID=4787 RepID=A0A8S9V1N9_PHYIN|nr:hypothetical protein GN958_ATG03987 [Phytophthora infestans]
MDALRTLLSQIAPDLPAIRTTYTCMYTCMQTTHYAFPPPDRRKQMNPAERMRRSARKRVPPESDSDSDYNVDDETALVTEASSR